MPIQRCAVFCGSRNGHSPLYQETTRALGTALAQAGITLVYGGGKAGLMGAVADAALQAGGDVKGVIPSFLEVREVLHEDVTDLDVTEDMPSRKAKLFDLADAYIVIAGGFGTLDEFYEVLVNKQLGLHHKPIFILNMHQWADPLIALINASIEQGFADPSSHKLYDVVDDIPTLINRLQKN